MKKIIALLLALISVFSLASCGDEFEPVESTEKEKTVVMTMKYGSEEYDIPYELYRAFFLTYKSEFDLSDPDYVSKLNDKIIDKIAEIYSVFYMCDAIGVDAFSGTFDDEIDEFIEKSVENIIYLEKMAAKERGETVELSRDEAYKIYLQRLTAQNLNYSVSILLYRYELALSEIESYYRGEADASSLTGYDDGKIDTSREKVLAFYNSESTVKLLSYCREDDIGALNKVEKVREDMLDATDKDGVVMAIFTNSLYGYPAEVERGMVIGKYTLSSNFFNEFTDLAFSLEVGEVSEVIEVYDGSKDLIYVLYRDEKTSEHFESCFADIAYAYVSDEIGKIKADVKAGLVSGCNFTAEYSTIDHASISMKE